jgi:O-antigen ligase
MWAFSIGLGEDRRLHGLATEPAQFCALILPAYYWYAHQFLTTRKHLIEVAVFTLTVALSGSSLGYVCVAFGIVLLLSRRKRYLIAAPLVVAALLGAAYVASPIVRDRADSLLLIATTGDVTGAQNSAYSFVSNAIVTQQVLKESPLIGNGIGSHPVSHARFLDSIPGVEYFSGMSLESMNEREAASLTFRVLSEFGILGYLGVLAFVIHFHAGGNGPRAAISNAILLCFLLKLIRSGEYYQPEQFFFIFIYILNYRKFKSEAQSQEPSSVRRKPWFKLGIPSHSPQPSQATAADNHRDIQALPDAL